MGPAPSSTNREQGPGERGNTMWVQANSSHLSQGLLLSRDLSLYLPSAY